MELQNVGDNVQSIYTKLTVETDIEGDIELSSLF
jgi:hypothetical protein